MNRITSEDVLRHKETGPWRELEGLARLVNEKAARGANTAFNPTLGGGTRLMLAMLHRISDDVDLFINDPQWLGYLTPRLNDAIEDLVTEYHEGATSLKLQLPQGEIDYIVSTPLLGLPNETSPDTLFALEPCAEVLAKKLFYRGSTLTPRDLFDWRMIDLLLPESELHLDRLAMVLDEKLGGIGIALKALALMESDNPSWTAIRTPYPLDLQETVAWAQARVELLRSMVAEQKAARAILEPPAAGAAARDGAAPSP